MSNFKIIVVVTAQDAALSGFDQVGDVFADVKPSALTERQRVALAGLPTKRNDDFGTANYPFISLPGAGFGGVDDVPRLLDLVADRNDAELVEKQMKSQLIVEDRIAKLLARPVDSEFSVNTDGTFRITEYGLVDRKRQTERSFYSVFDLPVSDYFWLCSEGEKARVMADPRIEALIEPSRRAAEATNRRQQESIAEAEREKAERLAESKRVEAQRQAEAAEKANRRRAQLAAWVADHGSDNQKKRFARGMLPESEIVDGIRAQAFASLNDFMFPRYSRIKDEHVKNRAEGVIPDHVLEDAKICYSCNELKQCDEEAFDGFMKIEETIKKDHPDAVCALYEHVGWVDGYDDENDPEVREKSIKVTLTVGELTLSREYAA